MSEPPSDAAPTVSTRFVSGGLMLSGDLIAGALPAQCRAALRMAYQGALWTDGGLAMSGDTLQLVLWLPRLISGENLSKTTQAFSRHVEVWRDALVAIQTQSGAANHNQKAIAETREMRIRQKILTR
jgi:hypothetical protein